jgi:hypothetical protein
MFRKISFILVAFLILSLPIQAISVSVTSDKPIAISGDAVSEHYVINPNPNPEPIKPSCQDCGDLPGHDTNRAAGTMTVTAVIPPRAKQPAGNPNLDAAYLQATNDTTMLALILDNPATSTAKPTKSDRIFDATL